MTEKENEAFALVLGIIFSVPLVIAIVGQCFFADPIMEAKKWRDTKIVQGYIVQYGNARECILAFHRQLNEPNDGHVNLKQHWTE